MKSLKITAIAAVTASLLAAPVLAGGTYTQRFDSSTIETRAVASKQEAYMLGQQKLNQLNASTPFQLKREFGVVSSSSSDIRLPSMKINSSTITTKEVMNANGELQHKALINVNYNYLERDRD